MTTATLDRPAERCWCDECQPTDPDPATLANPVQPVAGTGTTCTAVTVPSGWST